jgi:iron only hydrogenase large subunit-like protein
MSLAHLCQYLEPYKEKIKSLRAVREQNSKIRYMALLEMVDPDIAEELYMEYNGKPFSALEVFFLMLSL